jgi:hypothetical protein
VAAKRAKAENFLVTPNASMRLRWSTTSLSSTHLRADAASSSQDFDIGKFEILRAV